MCPHSKEGQQHPGLHEEECCHPVQEGDPSLLTNPGETTSGVLGPGLGSSVQERYGHMK